MPDLAQLEALVREALPALNITHSPKGLIIHAAANEIAWERPLSKKDMAALGDLAPRGEVLAIHVDSIETKNAWIQSESNSCFDSPHFLNYPAVLIDLERCNLQVVLELLGEHLD